MGGIWRRIAWLALMFVTLAAHAGSGIVGSPPFERFAPDLDVFPQNFAIAQDSGGIVYVGNTEGVLEFDGERWRLLRLPNREIVRSLAVASDQRVLVGGYNTFGYLVRDAAGQSEFHDLSQRFGKVMDGREFADIWEIEPAPEGVYFRGLQDVFFWNPQTDATAHWYHAGRFGALKHHAGTTYLQFRGEGFKRRDGPGWTLLPQTTSLSTQVYQLLPLLDGSLLTMGSSGEWHRLLDGRVLAAGMPPGMPGSDRFQHGLSLADGSIVLASVDGEVYIVDSKREGERHFRIDPGFLSSIHPAMGQGFLVSADQAFYRVSWPAGWSVLGAEHGALGSPLSMAEWKGVLHLTSNSSVMAVRVVNGGSPQIQSLPWANLGAYAMLALDDDRALLAKDQHLAVVEAGKVRNVSEELVYPRIFLRSRFNRDRLYVGTEFGLRQMNLAGGKLILLAPGQAQLELAPQVVSIVEINAQEVWTGTARHGAWRFRIASDGKVMESQRFGAQDGLLTGPIAEVDLHLFGGGKLMASTQKGFFELDGKRFRPSTVDHLSSLRNPDELLRLRQAPNGDQWALGNTRLFLRPHGQSWHEEDIRNLRRGAIGSVHFDGASRAMVLVGESILLRGDRDPPSTADAPRVSLRSVTRIMPDGRREPLLLSPDQPVRISAGDFGIEFQFALPDLEREGVRRYQGRLLGYENQYSEWSTSHAYTYSRISPGHYQLQVRAMDGQGRISEIKPWPLIIEPPWYATGWARAMFTIIAIALIWLAVLYFVRRRTQRMVEEKRRLETTVESRTTELAEANRRLEMMANVDGLTGIPNRRRLDEYLAAVWEQCRERSRPLSVLAIDVDHFKHYNDSHGHLAGDEVLKQLVIKLSNCLRRSEDLLARYGGEEFLVVLPGANLIVAHEMAESMRQALAGSELGTTISVGISSRVPGAGQAVSSLVEQADAALYLAKSNGRNCVEIHRASRGEQG